MTELPPELLHIIFIRLDLKQRLECLTVCRSWWKVLDSCSLFYSIKIRTHDQFNRFMNAFDKLPHHAAHVEDLGLEGPFDVNFRERNLFDTFPNVLMISVSRFFTHPDQTFRHFKKRIGRAHSKSTLEYLSDYSHCALTTHMLSLKLGDQLETLVLDFYGFRRTWPTFSQLKDLPVLKKLHLLHLYIKLHEIESIHCNIPSIQEISLSNTTLLAGNMPSDIIPANSITSLKFTAQHYADADTCAQMYQYMVKKYANINKVDYYDLGLKRFSTDQIRYLYLNGILDFLQLNGSKQSKLYLQCLPKNVNAFEALDAGNSRIKDLHFIECANQDIFEYLGQSKQSRYIEWLYMLDTTVDSIHPLKNMAALTALHIEYESLNDAHVQLADCLAAFPPSLKNLTIQNGNVSAAPFTKQLESIEYLTLSQVNININVGDIISNCFPNLIDLTLHGTLTEDVQITFKSPRFGKADFLIGDINDGGDIKYGFSFKCPTMIEAQYYSCSYYNTTQVDCGDIQSFPLLSVDSSMEKKSDVGYGVYIH